MTVPKVKVPTFIPKKTTEYLGIKKRMFQCLVGQAIQDMYKQRGITQLQPRMADRVIRVTLKFLNNNNTNVVCIPT